jgi:glucose-1-phosphate adenylyltransferase
MKKMIGVINLDFEQDYLNELTYFRCGAAVPFGGRYRLIDFVLSNMTSANVNEIAVFTRKKYRSLMDHLGTGAAWDLDRKRGGLFILPPDWNDPTDISQGDLQHFHNNRDFFRRASAQYVIISGSQHVCNVNYRKAYKQHVATGADVTVIYKSVQEIEEEHKHSYKLEINEDHKVTTITNDPNNHNVSLNMMIIHKEKLMELVDYCIGRRMDNFFRDGIVNNLDSLHVNAYEYTGHLSTINSIDSYYKHSLSLLNPETYNDLFFNEQRVFTKVKDEPPAKYLNGSNVKNSLIANGCVIEGEVENSILFRGVHVGKGTTIKNSIIMQRCDVQDNCTIENVILDKDIHLTHDKTIVGISEQPFIVAKRKII